MLQPVLYYIRHGETDWNVAGRLQGRRDIALNERGREQAAHCGNILRSLLARDGYDAAALDFVSSPLKRAFRTMEIVRDALGLAPNGYRTDERLAEISFGDWEGLTIAQLRVREPQRIAAREHDKWHFIPPGGESYQAVAVRVREWQQSLNRPAIVTAHGGTARGLIANLGIAPPRAAPLIDIEQGVVYRFEGAAMVRFG